MRRIPYSEQFDEGRIDPISREKEEVYRNLGHQFAVGTGVDHPVFKTGVTLGLGYSYQFVTKTSYDDGAYEPSRYRILEDLQPIQALHAFTATAGFSTVEWFKQKRFALPFQANIAYSKPFWSRNVGSADLIAGELVLFF
jgi:hypothetical protein